MNPNVPEKGAALGAQYPGGVRVSGRVARLVVRHCDGRGRQANKVRGVAVSQRRHATAAIRPTESPSRGRRKRSNGSTIRHHSPKHRKAVRARRAAPAKETDGSTRRAASTVVPTHAHRATPPDARACTLSPASWWVAAPPNMGATGSPREGGFHGGGCGVRAHWGVASCAVGATSGTAARD